MAGKKRDPADALGEVVAEAERLGAAPELLEALAANVDAAAELAAPILPHPEDAAPGGERLLAATFANVRAARAGELHAARAARDAGGAVRGAARRAETELRRAAVRAIARRLRLDLATLPYRGAKRDDALARIDTELQARRMKVSDRVLARDLSAIRADAETHSS